MPTRKMYIFNYCNKYILKFLAQLPKRGTVLLQLERQEKLNTLMNFVCVQ